MQVKVTGLFLTGLLIFLSSKGFALVGAGHMSPFIGQWTNDKVGGHESALSLWPYVSANTFIHLKGRYFFTPEVGTTFKKSSYDEELAVNGSDDEASSRQMIFFLMNFSYMPVRNLHLKFGVGEFLTKVSTEGGEVTRDNGGNSKTYYQPSDSQTSYNTTLNLGLESFVAPRISIKGEVYTWDLLDSDSRRWNFALGLNYSL